MVDVTPPVLDPQADTGWVSVDTIRFQTIILGRIMYTLDGTPPGTSVKGSTKQYAANAPIVIHHDTTVTAIHIQGGQASDPVTGVFIRAHAPKPVAKYTGSANFYPSLVCTLEPATPTKTTPTIRYTEDGSPPGPTSRVYTSPFTITKTETVRAYINAEGYTDGVEMKESFVLMAPPAKPVATPAGTVFQTNTLLVRLKSDSLGVYFRATTDPNLKLDSLPPLQGDSITITGVKAGEAVVLRAQAFKTQAGYPASAVTTETYTYSPVVASPILVPNVTFFYDAITLSMASPTPNASIRYELSGTPTVNSKDGTVPFLQQHSANFKAFAFKAGQTNSPVVSLPLTLKLTAPTPNKRSQDYVDSIVVQITSANTDATLFYTLDGISWPTVVSGHAGPGTTQYIPAQAIPMGAEGITTLRAIAVVDGIISDTLISTYRKTDKIIALTEPTVAPASRQFEDSVLISITSPDTAAEIRYTLSAAGQEPTRQSLKVEKNVPIRLDTTAVLWTRAFPLLPSTVKRDSSTIHIEHYTSTPSQPTATPAPGSAPFTGPIIVTLRSKTRNGIIHYTVNDAESDPIKMTGAPDSVKIPIAATCKITAIVVLGSGNTAKYGPYLNLHYDIAAVKTSDTLLVGAARDISGGYHYTNNSATPIIARTHLTDGMGLVGFQNTSLGVNLQPLQAGQPIKVTFTKPADQSVSIYRYANGIVEFVSSDSPTELTKPGEYFVGVDTLTPTITFVSQSPREADSTTVNFKVWDNVANTTCEITSPGIEKGKSIRIAGTDSILKVNLKVAKNETKALWMRVAARDFYNAAKLPKEDSGKFYLSQIWGKITSPAVLTVGEGDYLWDLAGVPVEAGAPVAWSQFRADNGDAYLDGRIWSEETGYEVPLSDSSLLKPGMAFWLGSRTHHTSVSLNHLRAGKSDTDGTYRIRIKHGWNQVTSPSLDNVYWPVTVNASKTGGGFLKAPYRFDRNSPELWIHSDTLRPWIGYFVYYYGDGETDVLLYTDAAKRPAAKQSALPAEGDGMDMSLELARHTPIRLGARTWAQDGAGSEDEPVLPPLDTRFSAWSQRGKRHLMTDLVRYTPGEVLHWNVILADSARGATAPGTSGTGNLRVAPISLPTGYEAWAVSTVRGMKFRMAPGDELPLSGLAGDTLSIYAGPAEKLSSIGELARAVTRVERFAFALEKQAGAAFLRLELPTASNIEATVWSAQGRMLAQARPGSLNPGVYRLRLQRGTDAQVGFLRLRVRSHGEVREYSRSMIW